MPFIILLRRSSSPFGTPLFILSSFSVHSATDYLRTRWRVYGALCGKFGCFFISRISNCPPCPPVVTNAIQEFFRLPQSAFHAFADVFKKKVTNRNHFTTSAGFFLSPSSSNFASTVLKLDLYSKWSGQFQRFPLSLFRVLKVEEREVFSLQRRQLFLRPYYLLGFIDFFWIGNLSAHLVQRTGPQ